MEKRSVSHLVRSVIDLSDCFFLVLCPSLTEKDALVTSLQEELREVREKQSNDAVRLH